MTGDYNYNSPTDTHITNDEPSFKTYSFTILDKIDLHKLSPDEYDEGETYRPAFSKVIWKLNEYNKLLKEIADDGIRAFFVSLDNKIIIAPYDGGIDFILSDTATRENYKQKYKDLLSVRVDGL